MEIERYINQKKRLYELLLKYTENGDETNDTYYQNLIQDIADSKIPENQKELKEFLFMLSKISKNHHRYTDFFTKIEKILLFLKDKIKQTFSNMELYKLFKNNKQIILFLLQNNIIACDKPICEKIIEKGDFYSFYFYPEIKSFIDDETRNKIENNILKIYPNILDEFVKMILHYVI